MSMERKKLEKIRAGQIVNVHGLKGEVKVYPLTDDIERFRQIRYLFLGEEDRKRTIQSVKYHKNMVILKLEGIDSVEEAEKIRERYLFIDRPNLRELQEDEYLIADLIGLKVYDMQENYIGLLDEVLTYSANDVYVIVSEMGKKSMVPAVKRFVVQIDVHRGRMIIDPIEGMIEK